MLEPLVLLITLGLSLMILERVLPARRLPHVPTWWLRVILINAIQLGVVVLGGISWEIWLKQWSLFQLQLESTALNGFLAYLLITFVFYWWHRWRHESVFLWNLCHQIHHSPQRIETITSFYKHPIEIILNSILIGLVSYTLLGLDPKSGSWVVLFTGMAEFFYHMNIRTPYWVGFLFQRPESHRIHHERAKHTKNFADLPLWDMVFFTFENPQREVECGFKPPREKQLLKMLLFKNVNLPVKPDEKH